MLGLIRNTWGHIRQHGLVSSARYVMYWASERWNERYFGIRTAGHVYLDTLGISNSDAVTYAAVPYKGLLAVFGIIDTPGREDVFVDFGAGMGRAVVVAACRPFKAVIGIELAPQLAEKARENVRRARMRFVCKQVEILTCDAASYQIPSEATVLHFYNPFMGETLHKVATNIRASLAAYPRRLTLLFAVPWHFEKLMKDGNVLDKNWIIRVADVLWPYHSHDDPNGNRYRIYTFDSRHEKRVLR